MDNELKDTEQTTETSSKENSDSPTVDLKELQARIKSLESENGKLKQSVTNASADASKWKKQYQDRLSDEERTKQQQDEANAALQKKVAELEAERNIAQMTGALVANDIGMDAETAKVVAEAMNAGDTAKVMDGIRQFVKTHDKALREDALKNNQTLPGGASTEKPVTREQFDAMSLSEMMAFKVNHPDLYAEYTK